MNLRNLIAAVVLAAGFLEAGGVAQESIEITKQGQFNRPIPIALSGFTGEAAAVLRFDLEVAGFEVTGEESAQYRVYGGSQNGLEGFVADQVTKKGILAKRYSGGSVRSQAHHFADDVVEQITGKPGIARTKIAFKGENGGNTEIYVSDYDGASPFPLTRDRALVAAPAWGGNGRTVFYTSYKSGYPDIYSQELSSGLRKVVAQYPGLNSSAAVSMDGRRVAMILSKGGSPDLYVSQADGSNLKQLTRTRQDESSPCWSPDGTKICFVSTVGGAPALYTISADGGAPAKLRTVGARSATEPDWSPDGNWIAFTVLRREFEICVIPSTGGEAVTLAAGEDPSWAPNSRTLLFTRREKSKRILSLLDVKTKRVKDVAQSFASCSQPSWAK